MRNSGNTGLPRFIRRPSLGKWQRLLFWGLALLLIGDFAFLGWKWPFTRRTVIKGLEQESNRVVQIGFFHRTLFPPGYTAENLVFQKPSTTEGGKDATTVRRMAVTARWSDLLLLRKRVELVSMSGLRMRIPAKLPHVNQSERERESKPPRFAEIGKVRLEDAIFAFPLLEEDPDPFTVKLQTVTFDRVNRTASSPFHARLRINRPDTVVRADGQMGPWNWNDPGRSQLAGSFAIEQSDLSVLGGIAGILTGSGNFRGPLQQIAGSGVLDVPQFRITGNTHSVHLAATFRVTVNGLNGDTELAQLQSRLNRTLIESEGTVSADDQRPGKAAALHFSVRQGYIEDFLTLFSHDGRPAMTGPVSMQAKVELPPGPPGFLEKVNVLGDFDITGGQFTRQQTQAEVNHLSKSAEGMSKKEEKIDPTIVFSDMRGKVVAQHGTAVFSQGAITVPGATAVISGTCRLTDDRLNLHGVLRTTGKLADTTSGMKTALLKVITPLWKKKSMTVVPFTISGTARNPAFRLDLVKKGHS